MMKRQVLFILILLTFSLAGFSNAMHPAENAWSEKVAALSEKLHINPQAFSLAMKGYEQLKTMGRIHNLRFLTIADFSKPSNETRLYVIDLFLEKIVIQSLVAHGKNSGTLFANVFSNKISSNKSSLGFYVTGEIYQGKHGASLSLNGVEQGINDQAKNRAIVMHGADYVSPSFIKQQGYIGRSQGCPAVPNNQITPIIESIQGASCLFVYAPNKDYLAKSHFTR
ncbi:MAG: hypothetical protein RLZ56_1200 [Bacteroidota bacterium]